MYGNKLLTSQSIRKKRSRPPQKTRGRPSKKLHWTQKKSEQKKGLAATAPHPEQIIESPPPRETMTQNDSISKPKETKPRSSHCSIANVSPDNILATPRLKSPPELYVEEAETSTQTHQQTSGVKETWLTSKKSKVQGEN